MRYCAHAPLRERPVGDPAALAGLLRENSESITSEWAAKADRILRRCECATALPTLEQTCAAGVSAMAECAATLSIASVDAYLDQLTATRLDQACEVSDVVEEFLLLQEVALPYVQEVAEPSPDSWLPLAQQLAQCVRCVAGRLCSVFAIRQHDRLRDIATLEERHRVAREIHDSMTQSIYSIGLVGDAAARNIQRGHLDTAEAQLQEISDSVREVLGEMRIRIFDLHPPTLDLDGLPGALRGRLEAVESRAGLGTTVVVSGDVRPPLVVEEQLLWIAHEVLNNTLKHARAKKVEVTLDQQLEEVRLGIADDGVGFELRAARARGGRGLAGIEERGRRIGAELSVQSEAGQGTRVRVTVKLDRDSVDSAAPPKVLK